MIPDPEDEFLTIYEMNNLDETFSNSVESLQIKDLQEGLAALTHVCCFLSEFILESFNLFDADRQDEMPKLSSHIADLLVSTMRSASEFIEAVEDELDEEEDEENGD